MNACVCAVCGYQYHEAYPPHIEFIQLLWWWYSTRSHFLLLLTHIHIHEIPARISVCARRRCDGTKNKNGKWREIGNFVHDFAIHFHGYTRAPRTPSTLHCIRLIVVARSNETAKWYVSRAPHSEKASISKISNFLWTYYIQARTHALCAILIGVVLKFYFYVYWRPPRRHCCTVLCVQCCRPIWCHGKEDESESERVQLNEWHSDETKAGSVIMIANGDGNLNLYRHLALSWSPNREISHHITHQCHHQFRAHARNRSQLNLGRKFYYTMARSIDVNTLTMSSVDTQLHWLGPFSSRRRDAFIIFSIPGSVWNPRDWRKLLTIHPFTQRQKSGLINRELAICLYNRCYQHVQET